MLDKNDAVNNEAEVSRMSPVEQVISNDTSEQEINNATNSLKIYELSLMRRSVLIFFGIVLPISSLVIELVTKICADVYINPIPSYWHVILVAFVPVSTFIVLHKIQKRNARYETYIGLLIGSSLAIATIYTILFAPVIPFGLVFLFYGGLGLLPLTPALSFITVIALIRRVIKVIKSDLEHRLRAPLGHMLIGFSFIIGVFFVLEFRTTITRIYMSDVLSDNKETSLKAINNIRRLGSEDTLLMESYRQGEGSFDLFGTALTIAKPVTQQEAQKIYYKVTGRAYNEVPRPSWKRTTSFLDFSDQDINTFDKNAGDQIVGAVRKDLSLNSSQLNSSIDADAALSYTEWTMTFTNVGKINEEARTNVILPPGGVVTRLTLWVNGKEQEAAFAGRNKVTTAYQNVVYQRRDPVLITTSSKDTVMVQCFPVPPNGTMKIRFGITASLKLNSKEHATLILPSITSRNFNITDKLKHSVWAESKTPLLDETNTLSAEHPRNDLYAVRGDISDGTISSSPPAVSVNRINAREMTWSKDPNGKPNEIIEQRLQPKESSIPKRIIVVLDGSAGMKKFIPEIKKAFAKFPAKIEYSLIIASENNSSTSGSNQKINTWETNSYNQISRQIDAMEYLGGVDNVPALTEAWNLAAPVESSAILWIHEPIPILLSDTAKLKLAWERRPDFPVLYDFQTRSGENQISQQLDHIAARYSVARTGSTRQSLEKLFTNYQQSEGELIFVRSKRTATATPNLEDKTSSHLARLWAFDQVTNAINGKIQMNDDEMVKLAATYQLVTPVSGAVVLENADQFKNAGLTPVNRSTVPTIPEPEEWALLIIAGIILTVLIIKRKSGWSFGY